MQHILQQDYAGHIECVVVFDQSAPQEFDVQVPDNRSLRSIVNVRTAGLAGARNSGIGAASGELVAFCDDDDEWLPGKLRTQVALLQSCPGAPVVASGIYVHYQGRDILRLPEAKQLGLADFLRDRHMEIHPCTFVMRRSALLTSVGLVDEAIPGSYGEDYEWLLRAARVSPVLVVQAPLVRVHWHATSFFADRWQTIIEGLTYLLDRYPEFRSYPAGLSRIEGQIAFAHAALGDRTAAWQWSRRALRHRSTERRAYLAVLVSLGILRPSWVTRAAHRLGRGI